MKTMAKKSSNDSCQLTVQHLTVIEGICETVMCASKKVVFERVLMLLPIESSQLTAKAATDGTALLQ